MNVPVNVYVEMTPNPTTMKFVANKYLLLTGESVEFTSVAEAKGFSPLAEELFKFPFVKAVFLASNFVSISKNDSISWDFVVMEIREFIKSWIVDGKDVLIQMPAPKPVAPKEVKPSVDGAPAVMRTYAPSEFDDAIRDLLDEYVRPAVESDGGAIDFRNFEPDSGIVTVVLRGSCSGCPSSTATLKGGIENLLKQHIAEVRAVVAEEA